MLDFLHLPPYVGRTDIQVFKGTGSWQTWRKPRGASMVYILCVGGGAAGGRGEDAAGGGGGGGGSGGHSRCLIQTSVLPDTLFTKPGQGGLGRDAGAGGVGGEISYVSVSQSVVANNVIARSGAVAATGGAAGDLNAGGGGGAGETIVLIATMPLAGLGHFDMIAGRAGSAGGSFAGPGVDIAFPTTSCVTVGGCGGAGNFQSFRGGEYTAVANTLISERRPTNADPTFAGDAEGGSGAPPFSVLLYSLGGCGGAAGTTAVGGAGGNGINGSGGGGSGAGVTLGGRGGSGGDGLVIIAAW